MEKNTYIAVSVMCSNLLDLGKDIRELEAEGVDYLHVDVMDAHFVPNLTFGTDHIKSMLSFARIPLDIHFMVEDPGMFLSRIQLRPGDIFTVHGEVDLDFKGLSEAVHSQGALFGVGLNPETPPETIVDLLPFTDVILLMLVHPGFSGSKLLPGILDKVPQTRKFLDSNGYEKILIDVDGSVSTEVAHETALGGANIFVGGTAGIYRKGMDIKDTIPAFRKAINI